MATNYGFAGPRIVRDGLVLYLDAANPNSYNLSTPLTWRDLSGSRNNGTLVNGTTVVSTTAGNVMSFDGVDDYVTIISPPNNIINWYTSNFTIQCNIRTTSFTNTINLGSPLIGNADPLSNAEYWSFGPEGNGKIVMYFWSGAINRFYSNSILLVNTWYNICFVKNSTTLTIFINSVSDNSTTLVVTPQSNNSFPFIIGGVAQGRYNGRISSLQVYNRELSQAEITQNYNATKGRFGL